MAKEDIKMNRRKLLKFLIALRDVCDETKFHMYDVLLDRFRDRKRTSQVMAAAIVSKGEILSEDFSALKTFTDYLHTMCDPSQITSKVVHHDRVAVVKNAGEKYFFEHGECRLFDPNRNYLFKIIDKEVFSHNGKKTIRSKIRTCDKGGLGVFENMENNYKRTFQTLTNAVILLYSFYIPCSIDFHNCAQLLHEFVVGSGHEMVIGYEHIHHLTDEHVSLKWLNIHNITVLSNTEMRREIEEQLLCVMGNSVDNIITERSCTYDHVNDNFDDSYGDVEDLEGTEHHRLFRRNFCRKIMKEYNTVH